MTINDVIFIFIVLWLFAKVLFYALWAFIIRVGVLAIFIILTFLVTLIIIAICVFEASTSLIFTPIATF